MHFWTHHILYTTVSHPVRVSDYACIISHEPLNPFFLYQTWYDGVLS